jgi:hypothetical protein
MWRGWLMGSQGLSNLHPSALSALPFLPPTSALTSSLCHQAPHSHPQEEVGLEGVKALEIKITLDFMEWSRKSQ